MTIRFVLQRLAVYVSKWPSGGSSGRWIPAVSLVCILSCLASPVRACFSAQEDSVHFNSLQPDFGVPPRRLFKDLTEDNDQNILWKRLDMRSKWEVKARKAELSSSWRTAAVDYQIAMRFGDSGNFHDRKEILDRMERASPSLASPGFLATLHRYLAGMDQIDTNPTQANAIFAQVYADPAAGFLREHALYQQASEAFHMFEYHRSVELYRRLLREFPTTDKREEALVMLARGALLPATEDGRDMLAGKQALTQLTVHFPRSRFRHTLLGLQARLLFLSGDYRKAANTYFALSDLPSVEIVWKQMSGSDQSRVTLRLIAAYLRHLPHAESFLDTSVTLRRIDKLRGSLTANENIRFHSNLLTDPDAAGSYLYYRMFHFDLTPHEMKLLTRFAEAIEAHQSLKQIPATVEMRLAEVYYRLRQYPRALAWANRACRLHAFDRALFVRGATREKLGNVPGAIRDFHALLDQCPQSTLRREARAELAILYEKSGDLISALDQYFSLRYFQDIAFLLDARMTIPEIRRCLKSPVGRSRHFFALGDWWGAEATSKAFRYTQHDLILYALGVRYLRNGDWTAAQTTLGRVPSRTFFEFGKGRRTWASHPSPDPITTAQQLAQLQNAYAKAHGTAARARALFRYGLYYSQHGTLLLYNAALWEERREVGIDLEWNTQHANREDVRALSRHMYAHEVYARSRAILLRVARRYPRSEVAPAALYFAAYASRYLARFNQWWESEDKRRHFWTESARCMKRVVKRYPRSPFAGRAREYLKALGSET